MMRQRIRLKETGVIPKYERMKRWKINEYLA